MDTGKHWIYHALLCARLYHDAGAGILLRRSCQEKKRSQHDDGLRGDHGTFRMHVGCSLAIPWPSGATTAA